MRQLLIALALLVAGTAGGAGTAQARSAWQADHPRRVQVNSRLANQNARIRQERATGAIDGAQAHRLHEQDHAIRLEERSMASRHDGHITRVDQAVLNRQENVTSSGIGR